MWRQSWQPSLIAATVAGTVNATVASTMAATLSETAAATVSPSTVARAATIASTNDNCHWLQRQLLSDSNIGNSHWWWSRFTKLLALSYNLSPIDSANCTLYQFRKILLDFVSFQHRCTLLHFWNAAGIISHHKLHGVSGLKHYSFCANQCKLHTVSILEHFIGFCYFSSTNARCCIFETRQKSQTIINSTVYQNWNITASAQKLYDKCTLLQFWYMAHDHRLMRSARCIIWVTTLQGWNFDIIFNIPLNKTYIQLHWDLQNHHALFQYSFQRFSMINITVKFIMIYWPAMIVGTQFIDKK